LLIVIPAHLPNVVSPALAAGGGKDIQTNLEYLNKDADDPLRNRLCSAAPEWPTHIKAKGAESNGGNIHDHEAADRRGETSLRPGHRTRVEILTILNDGPASHGELAKLTGQGVSKIGHHIKELLKDGSIELVEIKTARNQIVHIYQGVKRPIVSDEEARERSSEANNAHAAFILQSFMAETLASLWAGKLDANVADTWLTWDSLNLDTEGRQELAEAVAELYVLILEIETRACKRLSKSHETGLSTVVALANFARSRPNRVPAYYSELGKTD
jgi:DNA-binding transcriptional ArsR family regulator